MSRIIGLFACTLLIALNLGCSIEPSDERPGFGLSGKVGQHPVRDWSFAADAKEIFIETATPYFIPHSVTIWCVTLGNQLFVGAYEADTKYWVANVARDPNVRLKIGNQIYAQKLEPIADAATVAKLNAAYARKYEYAEDEDAGEAASTGHWRVAERD
ncbi:MAG TPA: DUF2255 family protein [Myxococcota bacterium]